MTTENSPEWPVLAALPPPAAFLSTDVIEEDYTPGVYLLIAEDGEIVYIGQSSNVRSRIATHRREGKKQFHHARFIECIGHSDRLLYEALAVLSSRPRYNRAICLGFTREGTIYDFTKGTFARLKAGRAKRKGKKT